MVCDRFLRCVLRCVRSVSEACHVCQGCVMVCERCVRSVLRCVRSASEACHVCQGCVLVCERCLRSVSGVSYVCHVSEV